jgi:hypothetical protein
LIDKRKIIDEKREVIKTQTDQIENIKEEIDKFFKGEETKFN